MVPRAASARGRGTLRHEPAEGGHVFTIGDVQYRVPTDEETMRAGILRVDGRIGGGAWIPLLDEAGMLVRDKSGRILTPAVAREHVAVETLRPTARGKTLLLRYVERLDQTVLRRTVQIRLTGQTLVLQFEASPPVGGPGYEGVTLGFPPPTHRREISIEGCPEPVWLLEGNQFAGAYLDRLKSAATFTPRGAAIYRFDPTGPSAPIRETAYVTLSRDPLDPLPSLSQPPSPHRALLESRLLCELTGHAPYRELRERMEEIARYGLLDLCLVIRDWRHSRDHRRLPSHYPADLERGSNEEFRRLVETARERGWLVALLEEYTVLSDDGPYWDPRCVARDAAGNFRVGRRYPWAIAADKMRSFARLEALQIWRNYRPDAAFLGEHTAWHPGDVLQQVDLDPANPWCRTGSRAIACTKHLLQFFHSVYEGPVIGEGGEGPGRFDPFYAGYADGLIVRSEGGPAAPVVPDYALEEVKPRAVSYGAGDYRQFTARPPGHVSPSEIDWDALRATEIALGHGGFLSTRDLALEPEAKWTPCGRIDQAFIEYFMLRALQQQYLAAPVETVEYWSGSDWLDLAQALAAGLDLAAARLRITYATGLIVCVNRHPRAEWSVRLGEATYQLPPNGWVARSAEPYLLTYSALVPGGRADVALCNAYRFLNARGSVARRIEGITTDGAAAIVQSGVPDRWNLYMVGARTLAEGPDLVKSSERCDFSLTHVNEREVELLLLDSESGRSCNVTIHYFAPEWQGARLGLQERVDGAWRRAPNQVQHTRRGVQVARLLPGMLYRLFLP